MRINVEVFKNVLELTEEEFSEYEEMVKDFEKLHSDKNFYLGELVNVYCLAIKDEKKLLFHERKYTRFVKKHYGILNTLVCGDDVFERFMDAVTMDYNYAKENYGNKEEIIKRLNWLLELDILKFDALSENDDFCNANYYSMDERELFFEIEHGFSKTGLFTDGNIIFKDDSGYISEEYRIEYHDCIHDRYPVLVTDANYVLGYTKSSRSFSDKCVLKTNMKIKNLMFDIDSLPTYDELQNGVFPKDVADYIAGKEKIMNQKKTIIDTVYNVGEISETIKRLLSKLEYYTVKYELTGDREEAKSIKAKLDVIKELYNDLIALKESIINDCFEDELMDEQELSKKLTKKRWDSIDTCC